MTMTPDQRAFLRRYVETLGSGAGLDRDMIPGVVEALADIALKEDAIRNAQTPATTAGRRPA